MARTSRDIERDLLTSRFERGQWVAALANARVQGLRTLARKTWRSALVALLSAIGAVTGFVFAAFTDDYNVPLVAATVCLIVLIFAATNLTGLVVHHRKHDRVINTLTGEVRAATDKVTNFEAHLHEAKLREKDEQNLPQAVESLLILISESAGDDSPQLAALAGPKLTDNEWVAAAAKHNWSTETTDKLRDANASLHRARTN